MRIGIDAGGTFTDFFVSHDDGRIELFKLRSNPEDPAGVILEGLARIAANGAAEVVHGSTVATNALLERKGARTAFLTTAGFEDIVQIGRQNRFELYSLSPTGRRPIAAPELCFGVEERTWQDGTVAEAADPAAIDRLARKLRRQGVRAVAVCLLHSYRNPANEQAVKAALAGRFYCSVSHEISPEFREFERASTTLVNAYVGPLMEGYLRRLAAGCPHRLFVMQSNGGSISAEEAGGQAVRTVLSGPAGGVAGALHMARLSGFSRTLGFDMGGTSTDVSLCDGAPHEATEAYIDRYPIRVPMLDIHTVGAGGGSVARVDRGGLLRVGPESAGAVPGPACYGAGEDATVTDAHVVLGRIGAEQLLGGGMPIDPGRSHAALGRIAAQLGLPVVDTAAGVVRVAGANMERAIRAVSVERGHDPRDFALVAFGGAGGLHACEIAAELGIGTVIAPRYAEVLSAFGMLAADRMRDYAAGVLGRSLEEAGIELSRLERRAKADLGRPRLERKADVRYEGQSHELTVAWNGGKPGPAFHRMHKRIYGFSDAGRPIEVVTVRLRARVAVRRPVLPPAGAGTAGAAEVRRVWIDGEWRETPVWRRAALDSGVRQGPALVLDYGSTFVVPAGWRFALEENGNLLVRRN